MVTRQRQAGGAVGRSADQLAADDRRLRLLSSCRKRSAHAFEMHRRSICRATCWSSIPHLITDVQVVGRRHRADAGRGARHDPHPVAGSSPTRRRRRCSSSPTACQPAARWRSAARISKARSSARSTFVVPFDSEARGAGRQARQAARRGGKPAKTVAAARPSSPALIVDQRRRRQRRRAGASRPARAVAARQARRPQVAAAEARSRQAK